MLLRMPALTVVVVLMALACAGPASAADTWVQVSSPNFRVVSNASEKRSREVAWQFEQIRAAMLALWPWMQGNLDRPVLVVAAKDENTMKQLVPQYWEKGGRIHPDSVFVASPDRHYIALRADARAEDTDAINPFYASYWSYSGLLLDASFDRDLPLWLRDGLAGVLSNTIVRENEIRFGMAPPWYLRTINSASRLRLAQLFTTTRNDTYYRNPATRDQFDAQSWAVLHYLLFDPEMGKSGKLDAVIRAVSGGTPSADAAREAFGEFEALEGAYMRHVQKPIMPYSRLRTETKVAQGAFTSRALSDAESANTRAALHAVMGRPVEARALIAEGRKGGEAAAGYEVEALLADRDDNAAALKAALLKAEQLGSVNFYALYRLALLEVPQNDDPAASAVAETRLRKVIELNALHVGAHATLANVLASGSADKRAQAVTVGQQAVKLAPRDAFARGALARSLWNAGQRDAAIGHARVAVTLAETDRERQPFQQMLDFFVKNAAAPR